MIVADLIRLFARHRNAANLLMASLLIVGAFALSRMNTQIFPDFGIDLITVSIAWPGASAEDVEGNVILAVEPEVRFLDNVKRVTSFAVEGNGTVVIEYLPGADMQAALSEVETAVAQIRTLPEDSERAIIRRPARYDTIARLILSGPYEEAALKAFAKQMRDELLALGIDRVTLFGARDEEIWVEIEPVVLRRLDLKLADIAERIVSSSQDLPSGRLEGTLERQLRSIGLETTARGLGQIEVRALDNGQKIYLRDVASVREAFAFDAPRAIRGGQDAIELSIQRAVTADALDQAALLERYLVERRPSLPASLSIARYDVQAELIADRARILLTNGLGGLALVLIILFVFLNLRIAFWVAAGIPVALMATMAVMWLGGQSINMVSMFALIMTLGVIVDDAIVVAEHAETQSGLGLSPADAASEGALRMLAPVTAASLTTVAAFLPIFVIGDIIGTIIRTIPLVAVAVLIASLIECFFVLPGHMRGALRHGRESHSAPRKWFNARFDAFRDGPFRHFVSFCVRRRYLTSAGALAMLIVAIGLVRGDRVGFQFFPAPESDVIFANLVMVPGTPRAKTREAVAELEAAALRAQAGFGEAGENLVLIHFGTVGRTQGRSFERLTGGRYGGVYLELVPADQRTVRTEEFIAAWRAEVPAIAGTERLALAGRIGGPPGREIDIRLSGGDPASLKRAADEVRALLSRFEGVRDLEDDLPYGKGDLILSVTPRGRALGFTTQNVGRQVRNAFEGAIASRFARGDEEVAVRVQYPKGQLTSETLFNLYLRSPGGIEVPLTEIVALRDATSFARIRREDGRREVAVTGEIDEEKTSLGKLIAGLNAAGLDAIAARHGLAVRFKGKFEEQARTIADMRIGAAIALIGIYIILAWVFASYSRPFVVMAVIPFGLIGAILGHLAMGFDLSILSLVALLGLSGILVNDSIVLVTAIDRRRAAGEEDFAAIVAGSQDRLRAVLLTSLTTIGGLTPLMFETSLQAQFLIPMAITIVFGLAASTLLVLIVVPALLAIQHDIGRLRDRFGSPAAESAL